MSATPVGSIAPGAVDSPLGPTSPTPDGPAGVGPGPIGGPSPIGGVSVEPEPGTLRQAILARLRGSADLAAIVGGRIYYGRVPQSATYPAVVFTLPSGSGWRDLDGPTGMGNARVRVAAWSRNVGEATATAVAVRKAFDGYRGRIGLVRIENSAWLNESSFLERDGEASDAVLHQIAIDFNVTHSTEG